MTTKGKVLKKFIDVCRISSKTKFFRFKQSFISNQAPLPLLFIVSFIWSTNLCGQTQAPLFSVEGKVSVLWSEISGKNSLVSRYTESAGAGDQSPPTNTPEGVGLNFAKIDWQIQQNRSSSLHLILRPDAASKQNGLEIEHRAGLIVDQTSQVDLLDGYYIVLSPYKSLAASFGVFDKVTEVDESFGKYSNDIPFGLTINPIEKSLGILLSWSEDTTLPSQINGKETTVVRFGAFRGNGERSDFNQSLGTTKSSVPKEERGAFVVDYRRKIGRSLNVYSYLAYEEDKKQLFDIDRLYFRIRFDKDLNLTRYNLLLSVQTDYVRDRVKNRNDPTLSINQMIDSKITNHQNLDHYFVNLYSHILFAPEFFGFFSFDLGKNSRPNILAHATKLENPTVKNSGHQYTLGFILGNTPGTITKISYARENRTSTDLDGKKSGGFKFNNGKTNLDIERFTINLIYSFDSLI